jgi:hypothetical protein
MTQTELFPKPKRNIKGGNGYASAIGSYGDENMQCRHCAHYIVISAGNGKYQKCNLMKNAWTSGKGTDIKASAPACKQFEKSTKDSTHAHANQ